MGPEEAPEPGQLVSPEQITSLMRTTRKTDPLFKPLKKLKSAL